MKTTVEIPEVLFRDAKARAALEGLSLRELFIRGLRLALQTSPTQSGQKANFPLIRASQSVSKLTDEQVYAVLNNDEDLA